MKKRNLMAAFVITAGVLAACGGSSTPATTAAAAAPATTAAAATAAAAETTAAATTAATTAAAETTAAAAKSGEGTELNVFAAASMTETMTEIIEKYEAANPGVKVTPTFDSSGTLLKQIQNGADCDLFVSAAPKQMNALEEAGSLLEGTRIDLLENKVTLAVPEGNPKKVESFDGLAESLKKGDILLAMGNSDVPVGQYTLKIFDFYGLKEEDLAKAGVITYGSNVKEVTTQVSEGSVDCGIIYATDAFSAKLTVVDSATKEMCGQVIYPAAVLKDSKNADAAKAFLEYLKGADAKAVFESVGFTALN